MAASDIQEYGVVLYYIHSVAADFDYNIGAQCNQINPGQQFAPSITFLQFPVLIFDKHSLPE